MCRDIRMYFPVRVDVLVALIWNVLWGICMECETCANYFYDEEYEEYICDVNMDEDDYVRFLTNKREACPFYRNGDEYRVVRKQM